MSSAAALRALLGNLQTEKDAARQISLLLELIAASKRPEPLSATVPMADLLRALRELAVRGERAVRAQALRAIRYAMRTAADIDAFLALRMDWFVARALERDSLREAKYMFERMQALKIVRWIMTERPEAMPRAVVQSLVAVAEHATDDFRRVCLDALRELVLCNPAAVASCGGIRTIVRANLDEQCEDIAGSLTLTILFLLDAPSTRRLLRPHLDTQALFAVFTDTMSPNDRDKEARRAAGHRALVTMMRSWTGILCLSSNPAGLRSLVGLLELPSSVAGASWAKEAIFDLLFEIMHLVKSQDLREARETNSWVSSGPNLLHNYIVMVLFAFMDSGLVGVLTQLAMGGDREFSGVARSLLNEILALSADLFPPELCVELNALPQIISAAAAFGPRNPGARARALHAVSGLENLALSNHDAYREAGGLLDVGGSSGSGTRTSDGAGAAPAAGGGGKPPPNKYGRRFAAAHGLNVEELAYLTDPIAEVGLYQRASDARRAKEPSRANLRQANRILEGVRFQRERRLADSEVMDMLKATGVLAGKDYRAWNWPACLELLEGPLCSPRALQLAMEQTKFVKRLLSFMRPDKGNYATLLWTTANTKYLRVGCQLFRVLLSSREGTRYQFFHELVDLIFDQLLRQVDALKPGENGADFCERRPFTRDAVTSRLSREYFTLVGLLSQRRGGQQFFARHLFFERLYKLGEDSERDHLTRLLVSHLDYSSSKPARTLLETWVKTGSVGLRLHAISHLRLLVRRRSPDFWQWGIGLLAHQLQYHERGVALAALSVLEEACDADQANLNTLIKKRPSFDGVGARANNLLTTFLSTSLGVEHLNRVRWIEPQLRRWHEGGGNVRYSKLLERSLVAALNWVPGGTNIGSVSQQGDAPAGGGGGAAAAATAAAAASSSSSPAASASASATTPSRPPPAETVDVDPEAGFVGPFGGFGGFSGSHARLRCAVDDYYIERVHYMPWQAQVTLEHPGGRRVQIMNEAYLLTVPQDSDDEGLAMFVVARVLDMEGRPGTRTVDASVSVSARLLVGAEASGQGRGSSVTCPPAARQAQCPEGGVAWTGNVRWNFEAVGQDGGDGRLALRSVWFKLPAPHRTSPSVVLAPHLYGELAKTDEGCLLLLSSGHLDDFLAVLRGLETADGSAAAEQTAALWALGQVGSSPLGFELLEDSGAVELISRQAFECPTLSLRGVCFYVLGVMSRTDAGRRTLSRMGWRFSPHKHAGVIVPADFRSFMRAPHTEYAGSWALDDRNTAGLDFVPLKGAGEDDAEAEQPLSSLILGHVSNLCNSVSQKASITALRALRKSNRDAFLSEALLRRVFGLLETYAFQLQARRFILFEIFARTAYAPGMAAFDADADAAAD